MNKLLLTHGLIFLAALFHIPALAQSTFSGGNGSQSSPYLISTTADLEKLAADVNGGEGYSGKYFCQTADLVFTPSDEDNFTPIGTWDNPFRATYDGAGHTISGVSFHRTTSCNGIFGYITGSDIANLTLGASTLAGYDNTGGIAGQVGSGRVVNCHVLSDVTITALGQRVGGIVGYMSGYTASEICGSTNAATIQGGSKSYIGGIIGQLQAGWVRNCFSSGDVVGTGSYVGGVVGGPSNETSEKCANSYFFNANIALPNLGNSAMTQRGKKAWRVLAAPGVDLDFGSPTASYGRVVAYATGLMVDSVFYAGGYSYWRNSVSRDYIFDRVTLSAACTSLDPEFVLLGFEATRFGTSTSVPLSQGDDGTLAFYMPHTNGAGSDVLIGTNTALELLNDDSQSPLKNSERIALHAGETLHVMLSGRTLQRDGHYNTLCLPFALDADQLAASPLAGYSEGGLRQLSPLSTLAGNEVSLRFESQSTIEAGCPFLIRWDAQAEDITAPLFRNVTLTADLAPQEAALGCIRFVGYYDALPITPANDDIYYLTLQDGQPTLCPTATDRTLKSMRAYFQFLPGGAPQSVKDFTFRLQFDETTGISEPACPPVCATTSTYDLSGRPAQGSCLPRGIYIQRGRKIVVR